LNYRGNVGCNLLTEAEFLCEKVIATAAVLRHRLKMFSVVYFWLLECQTIFSWAVLLKILLYFAVKMYGRMMYYMEHLQYV
jgi:hypothetical protein